MSTPDARPSIRALIFDMDGLLIDSEPFALVALGNLLRGLGHELRPGVMESTLGKRLPDAMAVVAETYQLAVPLDELTRTYDAIRLDALRGNIQPMPGATTLIAIAREAGLRLGLATSSQRTHADLSLHEAGLAGLFDAETTGDEVARGKPAPDIFLLTAQRLGIAPAACVVLEDAPAGVAAGVAAGMRCVCVPNTGTRHLPFPVAPDVTLPDLGAVVPWLRQMGVSGVSSHEPTSE
jgi:HAD superfamily hydrolase (TIGR01509 family)